MFWQMVARLPTRVSGTHPCFLDPTYICDCSLLEYISIPSQTLIQTEDLVMDPNQWTASSSTEIKDYDNNPYGLQWY